MTDGRPMASYDEMVAVLRETLRSGRSGTLYITTGDNHSGMFGIDKGKIVSLSYHRFKGKEALAAIRAVTDVRTRFSTLATGAQDGVEVPTTDEILRFLSGSAGAAPSAAHAPASPRPSAAGNTPAPKPAAANAVPGHRLPVVQIQDMIILEATEYLGPMAPHVCEEHFSRTPPISPAALLKVVDAIAAEVENSHRDKFRMRVMKQVEALLG